MDNLQLFPPLLLSSALDFSAAPVDPPFSPLKPLLPDLLHPSLHLKLPPLHRRPAAATAPPPPFSAIPLVRTAFTPPPASRSPACKVVDARGRDVAFSPLSGGAAFRGEEETSFKDKKGGPGGGFPVKVEVDVQDLRPLQANRNNQHSPTDMDGRRVEYAGDQSSAIMVKKEKQELVDALGLTITSTGDTSIGLKLGKRTYFEDGGAGSGGEASQGVSSGSNLTASVLPPGNNGGGKKQKTSTPASNVPRCQAEGCRTDLTNARDYHRRHKVCEWHAKARKVKVGNLEQRFCQQCSRFHVLSEFDEGKRSCRRRLAGHNERRRKQPQPDALPLLASGSFAYYSDNKHLLGSSSFLHHPSFLQHQGAPMASSSLDNTLHKLLRIPKEEPFTFPSLELHHFMQGTGALTGGPSVALSNLPGAAVLGAEAVSSSGIAASGRALSLLSSSPLGSPNNECFMSLAVSPQPSRSVEQLLAENQAASSCQIVSTSSGQLCFSPFSDKVMGMAPLPHSLTNSNRGVTSSPIILDREQDESSTVSSFDGHSMYLPRHDTDFQGLHPGDSQDNRPILNLMQIPSCHSQISCPVSLQQSVSVQYADLEGLRSYESIMGRQNIL